jgi:phage tail-like protein
MSTTVRTDPLRNFKFRVNIQPVDTDGLGVLTSGIQNLGFAQMSGIAVTNEVIPYREGGMNTHPHKMVGQSDFAPVSMARGVFANQEQLYNWQQFIHAWQGGSVLDASGNEHPGTLGSSGNGLGGTTNEGSDYRCDITVDVFDHPVTSSSYHYDEDPSVDTATVLPVRLRIHLYNAWPGSYSISDLNAGDNGIMIQQLQLHHEGFQVEWNPTVEA